MSSVTPMMHQYFEIKEKNPECLLFFRLGDFYEMFGEDAKLASQELDLTLTTRDRSKKNEEERIPMCGVPHHSAEAYISRLVERGYKVAICEQLEDPAEAKGIVQRDVIRIVTPGTLVDSSLLSEDQPNYLCALYFGPEGCAACFSDLSTGEVSLSDFTGMELSHLKNELSSFSPSEVLSSGAPEEISEYISTRLGYTVQSCPERFERESSLALIQHQFGDSADAICISGAAVRAVGGLLSYIHDTQKMELCHLTKLKINSSSQYMELDVQTQRSLELMRSMSQEKRGSLLWVLDKTKTPMGRRLIRSWVLKPLLSPEDIAKRLNAVSELCSETVSRGEIIDALKTVGDLERITGKISYGTANCRDLKAMESSLSRLPEIKARLLKMNSRMLREISGLDALEDIANAISVTIRDDPPFSVHEGDMVRPGFSPEVDRLRSLLSGSTEALADIEAREKERTGKKKLRIGYNKVFGYYIELPRSVSDDVPADYERKQTLANNERFITKELKELESELLTAKDRLYSLEHKLFTQLRDQIASRVGRIQKTSAQIAAADVLCSFAEVAVNNNYCMPEVNSSGVIDIRDGRHPMVELMQRDSLFVPNDTYLDRDDNRAAIITGPNMAGKSTYMRQTALIVLMAQIGSFVPARSARIGVVDRVFTRIGASDDLSAGKSTFMVEMSEVSDILHNATGRSLIILDEVGRGTSTYDGMSVARAVLEYCADKKRLGAKTLFSTHYHELTALEGEIPGVKNYNISAKKRDGDVIFLRKIVPGGADDSFGIEVAGLAGVPDSVISRAREVLHTYETEDREPAYAVQPSVPSPSSAGQLTMGDMAALEAAEAIRATDLNTITPIEAMNIMFKLKKMLD